MGWTTEVRVLTGTEIFPFATMSRLVLGPTQPPTQWIPGVLSLRIKRPGPEADHSSPSTDEVNNAWNYTSNAQYVMVWCLNPGHVLMARYLDTHRDTFSFYTSMTYRPSRTASNQKANFPAKQLRLSFSIRRARTHDRPDRITTNSL